MNKVFLLLCLILPLGSGIATARDWVVAPSGQGSACVFADPCTLSKGLSSAGNRDRVLLQAGEYGHGFTTQRAGVIIESEKPHAARFNGRTRAAMVNIKHDRTVIRGLHLDGKGLAGQKHGIVRFHSCDDVLLEGNLIENGAGGLVSIGGSVPSARISNVTLKRNILRNSGLDNQYGEAIYIGYHKGSGVQVKSVLITGNEVSYFSDNGVDVKPPAKNVRIIYNLFEHQVVRGGKTNAGTLVVQGEDVEFRGNIIRHVEAGKAVFNIVDRGVNIMGNVVRDTQGTGGLVRSRGGGTGEQSLIEGNWFCDIPKKGIGGKGSFANNKGLDKPAEDCGLKEKEIQEIMRAMQPDPPPTNPDPPPTDPDPASCDCKCECG